MASRSSGCDCKPEHPAAQPEAVRAILEADLIVLGPGQPVHQRACPTCWSKAIAKALLQSDALKVYVCNVATQPGETDGYDVEAHVAALVRHLPGQAEPARRGRRAAPPGDAHRPRARRQPGPTRRRRRPISRCVVVEDVVRDDHPLRHDPDKLAMVLMRICTKSIAVTRSLRTGRCGRALAYTPSTSMHIAFQIVQIMLAIVLIGAVLLQTRGSGFSAFGSSDSSIYRTRRGFERTLFQFTIVLAVCWVLVSIGTALTF